jgi:hypothetical protein
MKNPLHCCKGFFVFVFSCKLILLLNTFDLKSVPLKQLLLIIFFFSIFTLPAKERIYIANISKEKKEKEAILILPGFGSKMHGTKGIADFFFFKGYDVFIPDYISRESLMDCQDNLQAFIKKYNLLAYKKIHVYAYILGSWVLNRWMEHHPENNISSIVYDRSPLQERAPYAMVKDMPFLTRLVSGKIMNKFAQCPYPSRYKRDIKVGIIIESKATRLIRKHKRSALELGEIDWDVTALRQEHTDFFYTLLNHDEMYTRFNVYGNEILHFFLKGRFTEDARRIPYKEDPFAPVTQQKNK